MKCLIPLALLRYFICAAFFWMFVEGLYIFINLLYTLHAPKINFWACFFIGWSELSLVILRWSKKTLGQVLKLSLCDCWVLITSTVFSKTKNLCGPGFEDTVGCVTNSMLRISISYWFCVFFETLAATFGILNSKSMVSLFDDIWFQFCPSFQSSTLCSSLKTALSRRSMPYKSAVFWIFSKNLCTMRFSTLFFLHLFWIRELLNSTANGDAKF